MTVYLSRCDWHAIFITYHSVNDYRCALYACLYELVNKYELCGRVVKNAPDLHVDAVYQKL